MVGVHDDVHLDHFSFLERVQHVPLAGRGAVRVRAFIFVLSTVGAGGIRKKKAKKNVRTNERTNERTNRRTNGGKSTNEGQEEKKQEERTEKKKKERTRENESVFSVVLFFVR